MRDEAMNPNEAVNPQEAFEKALDAKIVHALEARPEVVIPAGFATRMASQVPTRRPAMRRAVLLRSTQYGLRTTVVSLIVLSFMLVALLANHSGHTAIGITLEWIIYAQFLALAAWLGLRRTGLSWNFRVGK